MSALRSVKSAMTSQVAVLLCTYNGQLYLAEQLDSLAAQTHKNWVVWASDDGSKDETYSILEKYRHLWGAERLAIQSGPSAGFAANFLSLTFNKNIQADFYAYSDQDDIWNPDKLSRALEWLERIPPETPALYCSRTLLIDKRNNEIGKSKLYLKSPSFANALMQNISGGNTMVFNNSARKLLLNTSEIKTIIAHDWWLYIVVTGCGGIVHYDRSPTLRYRQHDNNILGSNSSFTANLKRIRMLNQGTLKKWNDSNISALFALEEKLTKENREIFQRFANAREMSLIPRLIQLKRCGIHRQTFLGNTGLVAAAIFGKI